MRSELERRGVEVARRFGIGFQLAWFETELGILAFLSGDWDAAEEAFTRLDQWVAQVGPHYMEAPRTSRARRFGSLGARPAAKVTPIRRSISPGDPAKRRCCSRRWQTRP